MVIQHNMSALFTSNQLGQITGSKQKTTEKLASGYKINRAGDDAAGLSISEKMRSQIRGLNRASDNVQDGISYAQVAEGALAEVQKMMHRMTELCVQAANDTNTVADRQAIDREIQQLKTEMARVFDTTSFNTHKIWEADPDSKVPIPNTKQNVLTSLMGSPTFYITDSNVGALSNNRTYNVSATNDQITVNWTGYDGTARKVEISMADFMKDKRIDLSSQGVPIHNTYGFSADASTENIVNVLNGSNFYNENYVTVSPNTLSTNITGVGISQFSINLETAYQSHISGGTNNLDFDAYSASTLTPKNFDGTSSNLKVDTTKMPTWTFQFEMTGVGANIDPTTNKGTVTATSRKTLSYKANDTSGQKGLWWYTDDYGVDRNYTYPRYPETINADFTDDGIKKALTGIAGIDTTSPGLLSSSGTDKGADSKGGTIKIGFDLNDGTKNIGSFELSISVYDNDTVDSVKQRINDALNASTVLTPGGSLGKAISESAGYNYIEIPQYQSGKTLMIQAGALQDQNIPLEYISLNNARLGIDPVSVDSHENASKSLKMIESALELVSEERSKFGAYINRFEHAIYMDDNTSENTQAAESAIRDSDIAKEMMKMSAQSVLEQAGMSMLSQCNSSMESVLSLLQ